jgi:hypothetical protein
MLASAPCKTVSGMLMGLFYDKTENGNMYFAGLFGK